MEPVQQPTQAKYPNRATARTAIAVLVAIGVVVPGVWAIISEELAGLVDPEILAWVFAWVVTPLLVVSSIVTRVMAIPQVNAWLTERGMGATPRRAAPEVPPSDSEY